MKIVVLDGHTANPGDLDWAPLRELGECRIHPRTGPGEVADRLRGARVAITNKVRLGREVFRALPDLDYVGLLSTGYDVVDVQAAAEHGVTVCNVPAYSTESVAQATFALLLELTHRVGYHATTVRAGRWSESDDFTYWDDPLLELNGRTLGILGLGAIGMAVARIGGAFGMDVIAHTRTPRDVPDVELVGLDELFRRSDVLSLHCPLTPQTEGIVSRERLALMPQGAILLNTARGALLDEEAVADALAQGRLAGAGLDVLSTEPPAPANPLLAARHCIVTPHFAWASRSARRRLLDTVVNNLSAYLSGEPQNVVS